MQPGPAASAAHADNGWGAMPKATNRGSETRATRQNLTSGVFKPRTAHKRILQVSPELLAKSGWPSMAAISAASGRRRQTVWEHFQNARFAAWFDSEMDAFMASARSKARAKFAAQAMAGSVPHFVALGWSEAKPAYFPAGHNRSVDVSREDGPATIVIRSLVPRPPS
jgi:AcrR family transcriptional regulator